MLAALAPGASAAPARIELPRAPTIQQVPGAEPGERLVLPGIVEDAETVRVGLGPTGAPASVVVDQTLTVNGTGDFFFIVHGPALDVTAPPDAPVTPGLRNGDVIWAGFSPGRRALAARATMDPARDLARRLPVSTSVLVTKAGRPVSLPAPGPIDVELRITDTAGDYLTIRDAVPARDAFGDLLARLDEKLRAGRAPVAGSDGIPRTLEVTTQPATAAELVLLPVELSGTVAIGGRDVSIANPQGGTASARALRFGTRLSADRKGLVVRFTVPGGELSTVGFQFSVRPTYLDAAALAPPHGTTWRRWSATATAGELRRVLRLAQQVMWRAALYGRYRAYLGNPSAGQTTGAGESQTAYLFRSVAAPTPEVHAPRRLRPFGVALAALAAALILADVTAIWRRS